MASARIACLGLEDPLSRWHTHLAGMLMLAVRGSSGGVGAGARVPLHMDVPMAT